ncbi:uncharacterized protein F4812DRAFT_434042 [Daldinia caldariorum]|uniref:uncharacterized protein n=1 Tax=Daldinia caldariorum TaxID=326644 RepID=UPI002007DEDD|nr:uncharacterized protein F4812DRAFT_434042 [Daldinia caldariorum]KAI1466427.1 hypothetical protein F4812DRAFT_434042 [Daldinia caldariorum]
MDRELRQPSELAGGHRGDNRIKAADQLREEHKGTPVDMVKSQLDGLDNRQPATLLGALGLLSTC